MVFAARTATEPRWALSDPCSSVAVSSAAFRDASASARTSHCTFAVTDAAPLNVNVHVCRLLPPLEQAPDQIALRPFDTLSVIDVAVVNDADPVLPTATLIPAGLEITRSPLLPVAVTVSVAV